MNTKEIIKFVGAIVVALVALIFSVVVGKAYYHGGEIPEKNSYTIEIAKTDIQATNDNKQSSQKFDVIEEVKIDIIAILASGNTEKGQKLIKKKCASCHKFNSSGKNGIGPKLFGVVGRDKAAADGFKYSDAMKAKGGKWDDESLFHFLTKPSAFIPKTKMGFAGFKKNADIAHVISYLKTLK